MNRKNNKARISISFMGLFALACVFLVDSNNVSAEESVVDQVNITIPTSCSLSGTGMDTHITSIHNTQSDSTIGESVITAYCNDINGFSIYAIGFTNDEYGNNNLVDSNLGNTSVIPTGTSTTGNTSSWAMKLAPVTSPTPTYPITIVGSTDDTDKTATTPDYTAFQPVPNKYALVARRKAATDVGANAEGSSFTTTYQAYASSTQPAGVYEGQVKYTLVHPYNAEAPLSPETTASGKICYYANASSAEGTMGCQDVANSVDLLASNFSRTGYGFAGWSDKFDYATNPEAKFYGPQETMTIPDTSIYTGDGKGLSLYAVWVKSAGNLQDTAKVATLCGTGMGSLIKANEATNILSQSITALSDSRDNNTYAIAKLADGKCWMIENLRLDNTASLTLANTNNPLNDGTNVTLKHNYSDTETYNTLSASQDPTTTAWCQSNSASCDDQSMLFTGNTTNRKTNSVDNSGNIYSYGNYYNWYSATAGRGTYSFSTSNNSVVGDLCPAGWHLPKGGSFTNATNSDFWQLGLGTMGAAPSNSSQYASSETNSAGKTATAAFRSYPNNFVYSGYVYGSVNLRGSYGYFWSSTALSSNLAYTLRLYSSNVYPGTYSYDKYRGGAVRCVAPGV